jgi:serine/threonine-protein kinase HipA
MREHASQAALLIQLQRPAGTWIDVGELHHSNEISWFSTLANYWDDPERTVLGQVFEERGPEWRPSQRVTLPTWFSHLLPEGYFRRSVASVVGVDILREFFLLQRLGHEDLPGAVRALPLDRVGGTFVLHSDVDESSKEETSWEDPVLKFSLAGIQPKFSVLMQEGKGLTIPARGQAGDWIVKLPDTRTGFAGVPRVEFACMELARRIGLNVPATRLVPTAEITGLPEWSYRHKEPAFAIARFDRIGPSQRIHAEVLAQILEVPTANEKLKYSRANFETVASIVGGICGHAEVGEVIDRLVMNILVGNGDAHLKNWAVTYPDGIKAALSPLFDVVSTVLYIKNDNLGMKLNGSRRFEDVTLRSFDRLAFRSGWTGTEARERVVGAVSRIHYEWHILRELLPRAQYDELTLRRDSLPLHRLAMWQR